jgi:replication fork protection complex subunit Tof1/Swi1
MYAFISPRRDRTERDENIISLILHIWRNLAAIKDRPPSIYQSSETIEESHLQSELICQFASESVFDLLVLIASLSGKNDYNQWNMLVLEIMFLLFRAVDDPSLLVKRNEDVSKIIREDKLNKLLDAEKSRKRMDGRSGVTRHSRFGTTVVIENVSIASSSRTSPPDKL